MWMYDVDLRESGCLEGFHWAGLRKSQLGLGFEV